MRAVVVHHAFRRTGATGPLRIRTLPFMAATLQAQWNATYGATAVVAQLDQTPTFFGQRVSMAAAAAAVAIGNEATTTPNHANRVAFAKLVLQHPLEYIAAFTQALASQGLDQTSTDAQINTTIAAIWNPIAGAQ